MKRNYSIVNAYILNKVFGFSCRYKNRRKVTTFFYI